MPESNGLDIMADVSDFWSWLGGGALQTHLYSFKPGVEADLSKVIVYGESAGGYLAIQSGLTQPAGAIKAVIAAYPLLDLAAKLEKPVLGAPTLPLDVVEKYLEALERGKALSSETPPGRMDLALSMAQRGRLQEFFGADESLLPLKVLAKTKSEGGGCAVYVDFPRERRHCRAGTGESRVRGGGQGKFGPGKRSS